MFYIEFFWGKYGTPGVRWGRIEITIKWNFIESLMDPQNPLA
jgi:hypothetical protein